MDKDIASEAVLTFSWNIEVLVFINSIVMFTVYSFYDDEMSYILNQGVQIISALQNTFRNKVWNNIQLLKWLNVFFLNRILVKLSMWWLCLCTWDWWDTQLRRSPYWPRTMDRNIWYETSSNRGAPKTLSLEDHTQWVSVYSIYLMSRNITYSCFEHINMYTVNVNMDVWLLQHFNTGLIYKDS